MAQEAAATLRVPVLFILFFCGVNFVFIQSGDYPPEDLANFGYKLNIIVKISNIFLYFWLPT
jgi:hypothetical protein